MAISDLSPTNVPSDPANAGEGANELRSIKENVYETFPDLNRQVNAGAAGDAVTPEAIESLFDQVAFLAAVVGASSGAFALPIGTVVSLAGSAAVPAGWALCDGSTVNGFDTPDLTDRFIVCAGTTYPNGTSGGGTVQTGAAGDHNHQTRTSDHVLTMAELPATLGSSIELNMTTGGGGSDGISHINSNRVAGGDSLSTVTSGPVTVSGVNGDPHFHGIGNDGLHVHDVTAEPPYYALRCICYVGEAE